MLEVFLGTCPGLQPELWAWGVCCILFEEEEAKWQTIITFTLPSELAGPMGAGWPMELGSPSEAHFLVPKVFAF